MIGAFVGLLKGRPGRDDKSDMTLVFHSVDHLRLPNGDFDLVIMPDSK
jgi:hypothetical protein